MQDAGDTLALGRIMTLCRVNVSYRKESDTEGSPSQ